MKAETGYYLFDSLRNSIHLVDCNFAKLFECDKFDFDYYYQYIKDNNIRNIIQKSDIEISNYYTPKHLVNLFQNNIGSLTLSVTEKCNMKCIYCCYHDKFQKYSRSMSWNTAQKAIDYLLKNSMGREGIHLGFYGGECLIEFELIKKCVHYIKNNSICHNIRFGLTTNGLLLKNKNYRDFLSEHDFSVLVSLDGPKLINDRYRKAKNENESSYEIIINNLKTWRDENPQYFYNRISFNSVLAPPISYKLLDDFFSNNKIEFTFSSLNKTDYFNVNYCSANQEYFMNLDNDVDLKYSDTYKKKMLFDYAVFYKLTERSKINSIIPGAPCIPGLTRIYVNIDEEIYPCEKITEDENNRIGTLDAGVEPQKVINIINRYITNANKKCKDCWAWELCEMCFINMEMPCDNTKKNISKKFIYYIDHIKDNKEAIDYIEKII